MRVNIGYTCELSEVLEETGNLIRRGSQRLEALSTQAAALADILEAGENYNPQVTLEGIHNLRVYMARLDLRLEDVSVILTGLEAAKEKAVEAAQAPPVEEPAPEPEKRAKKKPRKKRGAAK